MRLIDADALKEAVITKMVVGRFNTLLLIDNAPTVERPHGKWTTEQGSLEITCSVCNKSYYYHPKNHFYYNFCPNCGADMRGGRE